MDQEPADVIDDPTWIANKEVQAGEILALESTCDQDEIKVQRDSFRVWFVGDIHAKPQLDGATIELKWRKTRARGEYEAANISHLPAITLHFLLPCTYPSHSPPEFQLRCCWLSEVQLSKLCRRMDEIWAEDEGCEVLYKWMAFLREKSLEFLGCKSVLNLTAIVFRQWQKKSHPQPKRTQKKSNPQSKRTQNKSKKRADPNVDDLAKIIFMPRPRNTEPEGVPYLDRRTKVILPPSVAVVEKPSLLPYYLIHFSQQEMQSQYDAAFQTCKICMDTKRGREFTGILGCGHVFCTECVREYLTAQIRSGCGRDLLCMEVACDCAVSITQIKALVDPEVFQMYDQALLESSLASMSDVVKCPRPSCQCDTIMDSDNMAVCSKCGFAFCVECRAAYHGVQPCAMSTHELRKLAKKYESASPDLKREMEREYGRRHLTTLLSQYLSDVWMQDNAKTCPKCRVFIEKSDGCNMMTCHKCAEPFCWLCGMSLDKTNPYSHFWRNDSSCFEKLMQGMDVGGDEVDPELAAAQAEEWMDAEDEEVDEVVWMLENQIGALITLEREG